MKDFRELKVWEKGHRLTLAAYEVTSRFPRHYLLQLGAGWKGGAKMLKKTELREAVYGWIKSLPAGENFGHLDAYRYLETNFGEECAERSDAVKEPRYKNDARWAAQDAKLPKVVKQIERGRFQRL